MSRLEKITFLSKEVIRSYIKSGTKIYTGENYWHSYDGRIVFCYKVKDDSIVDFKDVTEALEVIYRLDDTMVNLD